MPQAIQTRANHVKFDPSFHFFLAPLGVILMIWSIVRAISQPSAEHVLLAIGFTVLLAAIVKTRVYSLKVQDRLIRLEERLRLTSLAPPAVLARIGELTEGQLVALRFASEGEVVSLAERALQQHLSPKDIKAAIVNWRGDYFRV